MLSQPRIAGTGAELGNTPLALHQHLGIYSRFHAKEHYIKFESDLKVFGGWSEEDRCETLSFWLAIGLLLNPAPEQLYTQTS